MYSQNESLVLDLKEHRGTPAKVERVVVDGVGRTKDDLVIKHVKPILEAENFKDMMERSIEAKNTLDKLGIFKGINIKVDTYKSSDKGRPGYQIIYFVEEKRLFSGGVNTLVGQNDANLLFSLRIPNLFGRAEKLTSEYTHGTKQSRGLGLQFTKPVNGNPDVLFGANLYQASGEYPWSGYKEMDRGVAVDLTFPSLIGDHNLKWEGVWRDLRCLSNLTSFKVREQAGHTIKSCLKHSYIRDTRDDAILPSEGTLFKLTQEFAGLGGNAQFFKNDVEYQVNKSLFLSTVLQLSLAGGIVKSLDPNKELLINDKFLLGGPLTLRGFNMKGVGPHSDGNALGADTYCLGALHLYTPLPFKPGEGGFGELFRSHFFLNVGNCGNMQDFNLNHDLKENIKSFKDTLRLSYGAGVVLRLGRIARLELNYVWPLWLLPGDKANPGLQFGVGLTFL